MVGGGSSWERWDSLSASTSLASASTWPSDEPEPEGPPSEIAEIAYLLAALPPEERVGSTAARPSGESERARDEPTRPRPRRTLETGEGGGTETLAGLSTSGRRSARE